MEIIYASTTDPDASGGIGSHLHGMAHALGEAGHKVTVVCPGTKSKIENLDGYTLRQIAMAKRSFSERVKYDLKLAKIIEAEAPDLTIYRLTTSLLFSPLLALRRRQRRIVEINGPTWHELGSENRSKVFVVMARISIEIQLRCAHGFIAVSPLLRDYVRKYAPAIELPNGTDIRSIPNWNPNNDAVTLIFTGAFTQWYDIDLVLECIPRIESDINRPVRLVLVGDGPRLETIKSRVANDTFLASRVKFFPWMERSKALQLVAAADVGLIPLRPKYKAKELGSPLKLFDYVAVGIPTTIPQLDGCQSVDCSLISYYRHSNSDSLVIAVKNALKIPALSKCERDQIRGKISWSSRANDLVRFVSDLYNDNFD